MCSIIVHVPPHPAPTVCFGLLASRRHLPAKPIGSVFRLSCLAFARPFLPPLSVDNPTLDPQRSVNPDHNR